LEEELGINIPHLINGQPNPEFKFLFSNLQHFILNNGTYINNEFIDVYLVEKDVDIDSLVLQESEVYFLLS
jgi:hypothetical protein